MRSTSSMIRDYLCTQEQGVTFTTGEMEESLQEMFPDEAPSRGGIGGFCWKLCELDILATTGKRGRQFVYTLVGDPSTIETRDEAPEREGGYTRNDTKGRTRRKFVEKATLVDKLLELAVEVEHVRPSLELYSNEELLAELVRRQKDEQ